MAIDPFWNVSYNLRSFCEAALLNPSCSSEEELYDHLIPNLTCLNDNRNLNFNPRAWTKALFFSPLYKSMTIARNSHAADYTHYLFHQHQKQLMNSTLPEFEKILMKKINQENVDRGHCKVLQEKIQKFYDGTHFFFSYLEKNNKKVTTFFQKHFCENCFDHFERLYENYAIISLQAKIGDEIPLHALIEASYEYQEDNRDLVGFAKVIVSKNIETSLLHQGLCGIISHAQKYHQTEANKQLNRSPDISILENNLYDLNPAIFEKADLNHVKWRASLTEDPTIDATLYSKFYDEEQKKYSTYKIILDKQLSQEDHSVFDNNIYFEIKQLFIDDEDQGDVARSYLVWIPVNLTLAGIKRNQSQQCEVIRPAEIPFIDSKGRFALVEKLHPFPDSSNQSFYHNIAEWINELYKQSITLNNLNADNFMLSKHPTKENKVILSSIKITKPQKEFSFSKLVQFVYDIAKGDPTLFKMLMDKSSLSQTDEAMYIKKLVCSSFKHEVDSEKEAIGKSFKDKMTPINAIKLQQKLHKIRDDSLRILKFNHQAIPQSELESKIIEKYVKKEAVTFLWPTLQSEILNEYIQSN